MRRNFVDSCKVRLFDAGGIYLVARGIRRSLLPQPFDETFLLEPVYKRTIDKLFWIAARGIGIFFAEIVQYETDSLKRRLRVIRYQR
jgi:hypothetical protein